MDTKKVTEELSAGAAKVQAGKPTVVEVKGKKYKVRQISQKIELEIRNLEKEVFLLEHEAKGEITLKRAKAIDKKMYTLHSKMAAYYLLGNWALYIPFLWALTWRWLFRQTNEVTFAINNVGSNNEDVNFSFANWQITKARLALSTMLVGNGIKQWQERMESSENMLGEDALPKKEDSK